MGSDNSTYQLLTVNESYSFSKPHIEKIPPYLKGTEFWIGEQYPYHLRNEQYRNKKSVASWIIGWIKANNLKFPGVLTVFAVIVEFSSLFENEIELKKVVVKKLDEFKETHPRYSAELDSIKNQLQLKGWI